MGGTTITIQKDNLLDAIQELIRTNEECNSIPLWLDSITIGIKNSDGSYFTMGNEGKEIIFGSCYEKNKNKNIVIFAHFGK